MNKDTKEHLQRVIQESRQKLDKFESAERKKRFNAMLGNCYKYSNSYGGDKRWWLYAIVTGDDGYWPRTFSFQVTDREEVEFKNNDQSTHIGNDGWTRITLQEFKSELESALLLANKYARAAVANTNRRGLAQKPKGAV